MHPCFLSLFLLLAGLAGMSSAGAQAPVHLSPRNGSLPPYADRLADGDQRIRADMLLNERLLDLVEARSVDSVLTRRRIKHRFWGIRMPWLIGLRWEYLERTKQKFVGTCRNDLHQYVFGSSNEHDVNFDLVPHLPHYLDLLYGALSFQYGSGRRSPLTHPRAQGSARDRLRRMRRFHCECTPPYDFHARLDSLVYPVLRGKNMAGHPNFGEPTPTLGLYGPVVADCNHTCHPEIHPYEWLWWRELQQPKNEGRQVWFALFLRDDSQRMKAWQKGPRLGEISFPLVFSLEKKDWQLTLRHLLHVPVPKAGAGLLDAVVGGRPAQALEGPALQVPVTVEGHGGHTLTLRQEGQVAPGHLRYQLGEWAVDPDRKLAFVRLHLFVGTEKLYAVRVDAE
jgi:hypothetical protein